MSITRIAKTELDARISGHDDISAIVRLPSGVIKTNRRHTFIAPPSMIEGDAHGGMLFNDEPADAHDDMVDSAPEYEEQGQVQDHSPVRPSRTRRARKQQTEDKIVAVSVTMPGFGTIPTAYSMFDVGAGCLRLGIISQSWIPAAAGRLEDGSLTNVFEFDRAPGRRYVYLGMEFMHEGQRNIVLVEAPPEEG